MGVTPPGATQDLRLQAVSTVLFGANRIVKVRLSELFVENIHFTIFKFVYDKNMKCILHAYVSSNDFKVLGLVAAALFHF